MNSTFYITLLLLLLTGCKENRKEKELVVKDTRQTEATTKQQNLYNLTDYINNNDYFIRDIDINKDGVLDKIVCSDRYKGNELLFFQKNGDNYSFKQKTINFSEDGGRIIEDVLPEKKSDYVLKVKTFFPDGGINRATYYIEFNNGIWKLQKTIYETGNWRKDPNMISICEVQQNILMHELINETTAKKINQIPKPEYIEKYCKNSYLFDINNAYRIKIIDNTLTVVDSIENTLFTNENIIRGKDEGKNCMSQGFQKIVSKGDFFTVEQQNCTNNYIINEYITFKYNKNKYLLSKIGYTFIDKQNPKNKVPGKIFTSKDFGRIRLEDVNIQTLYKDMINKT